MARFQGPSRFRGPVTPTAPQDTGSLAGDIGRSAVQGAAGFGTSLANLANLATGGAVDTGFKGVTGLVDRALGGPGEGRTLAQAYRDTSNTLQGSMSSETQRQQADVQREIGEADSAVGEFGAAALGYLSRPRLLAQQVTQSLPYMLGPMSLSTLATTQAGRIGANVVGSGLIGGGVAAIEAQGDVMEQPQEVLEQSPGYQDRIAMGMTPAQARESLARRSGGIAAGVAGPVSAAAGLLGAGVETRALAGGLGARAIPGAIAREAAEEAIQEPSEVVGQNIAARDRGEDVDVFEGAPAASGAGAVVGGVFGGSLATLSAASRRGTPQSEQDTDRPASDTAPGQPATPGVDQSRIPGQGTASTSPEAIADAQAIREDPARLAALPEELRNLEAPALAEALASTQPPSEKQTPQVSGEALDAERNAQDQTDQPASAEPRTDQSPQGLDPSQDQALDESAQATGQDQTPSEQSSDLRSQQPPIDATPDNTTTDISTAEAPYLSDEGAKTQTVEVIEGQDASVPGVPRLVDPTEVEADRFSQELDAYAERFGLSEEAKAAAQQAFSREPMRDTVTGFYMAQDRVPTIERAKQAVRDGQQALYFEMDIRNLGGLNKRFGHTEANTVYKRFSDAANEVLAGTGARVVPFRHGGDEISAVVVGVDPAQAETIAQAIEARSQEIAQELGIADIEHTKEGIGPGTGLYAGWSVIDPDADIATITSRADQRVEAKKVEYGQTTEATGAGQAEPAGAQGEATGDAAPNAGGRAQTGQEVVASASKAAAMRQFKTRTKSRSDAKKIAGRTALYERDGQYYRSDSVDDLTALPAQGWTLVEAGEALTKKAARTQKGRTSSIDPLSLSDANLNQLAAAMGIAPQSSRATISREVESRPAAEIEAAYRKAFQSFDLAQPDGGMSAAEIQEIIAPYLARWRNAPEVEIVETAEGLPDEAKAEQGYGSARGAIISVDGASRVYLVAGNIPNADRAIKTLAHEVLGHYGVEGLLPEEFTQLAQQINRLRDTNNKALREVFDDVESRYPGASDATFGAESVAVAAERGIDIPVIRRLLASLRAFLRDTLGIPLEFSANELRAMLADTLRKSDAALTGDTVTPWNRGVDIQPQMDRGRQTDTPAFKRWFGDSKVVDENGEPLVVFHGTNQSIDSFSKARMGANTGSVSSRKGFYFTEDAAEASDYAEMSARKQVSNAVESEENAARLLKEMERAERRGDFDLYEKLTLELEASEQEAMSGESRGANITPVYLSIKNPMTIDFNGSVDLSVMARKIAEAKEKGHDGLRMLNVFDAVADRPGLKDTTQWVAFRPEQIKSAVGNRGTFDPADPRINFDRIGDLRDLLSDIRSRRQSERRSPTQFIKDLSANTRPAWMNLLSRQQLVEIGSDILPSAARFEQFAREMDAITNRENDRYYPIARKWTDMAYGFNARLRRGVQAMSRIMEEATIMRYDPDNWDVMRDGPPPPGAGELRQRYEALPSEVKQLYREVRDAYSSRRDDMQEALIERIMASEAPPAVREDFADRLRLEMEAGKINPYFPLSRFGDWFVVGRKGDKHVFYLAESEQEQRLIARNVAADGYDVEVGKQAANLYQRVAPNEQFIGEVAKLISGGQVDPADPMIDELYQMYLRQLPESSVRKHFIHRKGIVGASKDQLRAFSTQMGRGSKQLGRLKTGYQMQRSLTAMQREAAESADPNRAQDIINQLQESFQWMMNPTNATWANRLTSLGFAFYLGVSPAAALVNATQLAVITFPTLAARYGWRTASRVLSKRMAQVAGMTAAELGRDQPSQMRQRISAEYNGDMGKMLEQLEHDGTISRTQTMALAGLSEQDALGLANPILEKTMRGIGYLFQKAEVYNREATAIAAYELDRAAGKDHETAVQAAKNAVWQTHYDYSSGNRAKIMRGNTQRVLFLFKQYSQNTAYLLMRGFYNAFAGATPEEKRFARQQMMGIFGMTGVLAGATGLPLYGSIMAVAQILANIYDDDDDEIDVDVEFRNFLNDALGDTAGQIMQTGFANQLTGLDIAARTSLANLFVRPPSRDLEGRDLSAYWLEQAAGPVAGIAINWTRAAQLLNDGELYRGVETAIPKFMRDVMKAGRYTDEGVLNMRGDPIVQELNAWQLIGQANGFTPAEVSEQYERNNAVKNAEQRILDRRRSLANGYWLAMSAQDTEAMQDVIRKIAAFNRAQPAVAITGETLKRSIQSRQNASTRSLSGVNVNPNLQPQLERAVRF